MVNFIFYLVIPILAIIDATFLLLADIKIKHLERENRMIRRLLSEQASLHEMSLDAYVAMLQEARRYTDG